jgi:tetratricopeptide (TPR) repeat protein
MPSTSSPVHVRRESIVLPTYEPLPPDKNPMFLEKRVYQGSSGRVYPLPFYNRIAEEKTDRAWDAVWLENEFIQVLILPEIGGRIHIGKDKTNGYDFFYRQDVIKPALVGLAGPWISGGVEFNWPQHHRPATCMPVDVEIERHADGSVTVWCGDHDPMARMKGMHGVCLYPDRSYIELKVRAHNRTQDVQTFLWWANVATRVHEQYQSFFPPDVTCVADHARRSMSEYPLCKGHYYGVDYAAKARAARPGISCAPNDLSFYANIPVPTSYMAVGSKEDFFGGYDHRAQAGVVHIANHHISPGKKQWTWGNQEFGRAWDRSLTAPDKDGSYPPYIELMSGVYTDNQPDFSFLMPGETKTWSQFWYPIQKIGVAHHANLDAAISLAVHHGKARAGVSVSTPISGARIEVFAKGKSLASVTRDLAPGIAWVEEIRLPKNIAPADLHLRVSSAERGEIIAYQPKASVKTDVPPPATEPPLPREIVSADELYLTGLHLEQYRHATRDPAPYWLEALRRDSGDARCNNALGRWHLRRGEFDLAERHFRASLERLRLRNSNPYDGEPLYNLGQTLRHLGRDEEAYGAFYKAIWNHAWQSAGYHALAEIDCKRGHWSQALEHLDRSLRLNTDNLGARNLRVVVLRRLGREEEATRQLDDTRALDPLDWWSRHLAGETLVSCTTQTRLDLALDFARAGLYAEAINLLEASAPEPGSGATPLVHYHLGWLHGLSGNEKAAKSSCRAAAAASPDYCFPARLEEIAILEHAIRLNPKDARAPYYLGNLLYDRRRHREAINLWQKAAALDPTFSVVWRNLGIGWFNITGQPAKARTAYEKAFRANPRDARLLFERDQLWKRLGVSPERRLRELEKHRDLVTQRDDLSVELSALLNQTGRHTEALELISSRNFQPWEGGEGQALGQHVRTHLALGRAALEANDAKKACDHFQQALSAPHNLSEANHPLANQSDIHYWLGVALEKLGKPTDARRHWTTAAEFRGDFQEMSVRAFSELTYYSALALRRLGRKDPAEKLCRELLSYARSLEKTPARIDYFATSLPTMLLFDDDLQLRQTHAAWIMQAQAEQGLGRKVAAQKRLRAILKDDPAHAIAADFLKTLLQSL